MFGHIPFVRYLLFFLPGIFASEVFPATDGRYLLIAVLGWSALSCIGYFGGFRTGLRIIPVAGICLLGWSAGFVQSVEFTRRLTEADRADYLAYQVRITDLPEKREKNTRYKAAVEALLCGDTTIRINSRAIIYFSNDLRLNHPVGQRLAIKGKLVRPPDAGSEMGFSYRKYLERNGIPWIGFAKKKEHLVWFDGNRFSPGTVIASLTGKAEQLFKAHLPDADAFGLVKAMILGRREDIRPELNQAFTDSGTVHVLSVSGLHVAVFFSVLHFIFGPLRNLPRGRQLYLVIISAILIVYAVVTGLPASVQRATLMCLTWMTGQNLSRKHQPLNTLGIAAFFILLSDPAAFYDVGFQLSFLAMLGIFLWMKPLQSWYTTGNRILKHIRDLFAMSIAAQLMTLPLILFYFNQFPTYFLLANLFVVDLAGMLIPAAIGLLVLGALGFETLAGWTGQLISLIARVINRTVEFPRELPYHVIDHLYLDPIQALLLLVVLLGVYSAWIARLKKAIAFTAAAALCFCIYSAVSVLNDYGRPLVQVVSNGNRLIFKSRSSLYIIDKQPVKQDVGISEIETGKYLARYGGNAVRIELQ